MYIRFFKDKDQNGKHLKRKWNSMQIMVVGFLAVILLGALLLMLPFSIADGHTLSFVDALFTATTSACVTGLTTTTIATTFTIFGKIVIMILIQLGGWGVIICAMYVLVLLKRKISVGERVVLQTYFNLDSMSGLIRLLLFVVKGSLVIEGLGAIGYAFVFVPRYGLLQGIWYSVFHAVSAFNNAGIDILGEQSLAEYVTNPWINIVTMLLIICGGIGFLVWEDLVDLAKKIRERKKSPRALCHFVSLQTKLVLVTTVTLILLGTIFVYFTERNNPLTLGGMKTWQKWMAAMFQSVTTRTAGFYTISQPGFRDVTKLGCAILMFIGGSPVGTAGGIKTVTIAVLILSCISTLRGKTETECYGRRISMHVIRTSVVIVAVAVAYVFIGTIVVSCIQPQFHMIDVMYEVISATATVGLTAGITSSLVTASKIVIIILMYIGRVGPITLPLLVMFRRGKNKGRISLPEEHIIVG